MESAQFIDYKKALEDMGLGYGDHVGDFGCGTSAFFTLTAARIVGEQGRVYAVDVVKEILDAAENKASIEGLQNIQTVWSDLEILGAAKIPDESLDAGILANVLFQSKKPIEMIKEALRTLKPGAKLLIADWKKEDTPIGPPTDLRVSPKEAEDWCQGLGVRKVDTKMIGEYTWSMVFVKQ